MLGFFIAVFFIYAPLGFLMSLGDDSGISMVFLLISILEFYCVSDWLEKKKKQKNSSFKIKQHPLDKYVEEYGEIDFYDKK